MIDDPELRALFKAESEEHLQTLESGLLRLESEPGVAESMLEELFRSAHSLKGAAGMLDVSGVETLAHHFEDQLGAARHGHLLLTPALTDRLYQGLDAMRRLSREASDGEPAQVDIPLELARLRGEASPISESTGEDTQSGVFSSQVESQLEEASSQSSDVSNSSEPNILLAETPTGPVLSYGREDSPVSAPQSSDVEEITADTVERDRFAAVALPKTLENIVPATPLAGIASSTDLRVPTVESPKPWPVESLAVAEDALAAGETQPHVSPTTFKIETIRVEPQKLDVLMTLTGEMTVTTTLIARALDVISDLVTLSDEWAREARARGFAAVALTNGPGTRDDYNSQERLSSSHEEESRRLERLGQLLAQLERTSDEGLTRLAQVSGALDEAIRSMRLLPFSTVFNLFPRLVRDLSREQDKEVHFVMEGGTIDADKHLLEEIKDPLMHMLRNSIDHGIEPADERLRQGKPREATLRLRAVQMAGRILLEISDDGRGLNEEAIRGAALRKGLRDAVQLAALSREEAYMLIFEPGFSTSSLITNVSGRGVGMDVVRTNIERLKGTIEIESVPGRGCTFRMEMPLTLATTRVLLVRAAQQTYAIPVDAVKETLLVSSQNIFSLEGRPAIRYGSQPVSTVWLTDLLELPRSRKADMSGKANSASNSEERHLACIFLSIGTQRLGLFVDALLDEQEILLKPFGGLLQRVRNVLGATVLSNGEICMVLNPQDLMKSAQKDRTIRAMPAVAQEVERKKVILLAEDSITTRTQEKRILEGAGYSVITAVDGRDAFNKLGVGSFDAVVSDVEMPNMDGLTLAARIRQDAKYKELPIILVTSLASDSDRQRGREAGANAYLTKGTFEQKALLDALRRLV